MKNLIKNTLSSLQAKKLEATPDNYFKEFCIQAKLENKIIYECEYFGDLVKLLKDKYIYFNNYNITSYSELADFLMKKNNEIKNFVLAIDEVLSPSINYDIEDTIHELSKQLIQNPNKLSERETITQIKNITKTRIINDRKVLREKSDDINKLTTLMSKYFENVILQSDNSVEKISEIKEELDVLDISTSSYRELNILKTKLVATVHDIQNTMIENKKELTKNKKQFSDLEKKVIQLQKELISLKEEKSLDYLTNVLNRRAFDEELEKIEKKYNIFDTKYAIIFYDLDHFKSINDTYGHPCGDAVLKTFSAILKGLTRQEDIIARYGGEEFVVLLNYNEEKEIFKYMKRVQELVKNRDFNYKNNNIDVKFSAGVALRNKYKSQTETIKAADDLLYEAKANGRDQIMFDNPAI